MPRAFIPRPEDSASLSFSRALQAWQLLHGFPKLVRLVMRIVLRHGILSVSGEEFAMLKAHARISQGSHERMAQGVKGPRPDRAALAGLLTLHR